MSAHAWLPLPDYLVVSGLSRRTFFRRKKAHETKMDGGRLVVKAALPAPQTLSPSPARKARAEMPALGDPLSSPMFAGIPHAASAAAAGAGRRIALTPKAERQALERLQLMQPLLDFCAADRVGRARFHQLRLASGDAVRNSNDLAQYLVETNATLRRKLSCRQMWEWKRRYEKDGLAGLARKVRSDKGRTTWAQFWPSAAALVAATYLQAHHKKQAAYDALLASGIIPAERVPSYATVCTWLDTLPKPAVVLAREGERAHNERMAPYISRGYTDVAPNQIWVADTMLHDVLVRNDCFGATPDNAAIRPQLTCIIDMRSRKVVGSAWVLNGSSRSITTALRSAVLRYGPPQTFYCDHGSDFKKVGHGARPENDAKLVEEDFNSIERGGALRQLGVTVQYCMKYHPQSKHIERFFGTLHGKFDSQFPHYTTGNAYKKPDATVIAAANHGKLLRMGRGEESPLVAASHFIRMAALWIEEYNASHKHSGHGMNRQTPDQVFAPALTSPRDFDRSILDTLLWQRERRTIRECSVTVDGRRMIGVNSLSAATMYDLNEREVLVCFDPNAPEVGVVTNLDGHKLADVYAEHFVPHSAEAGPAIQASMQQRGEMLRSTKLSITSLRKRTSVMGHKPAIQLLSERALQLAPPAEVVQPLRGTGTHGPIADEPKLHTEDILARFLERSGTPGGN